MLRRTAGTLRQDILLEASARNGRSGSIRVLTVLALSDSALRRWCRAHPDRDTGLDDHVCGTTSITPAETLTPGGTDLGVPHLREKQLTDWLSLLREHAVPWFAEAGDPDRVTGSRAAGHTFSPAWIVEWLASVGRTDVVPTDSNDRQTSKFREYATPPSARYAPPESPTSPPEPDITPATAPARWHSSASPDDFSGALMVRWKASSFGLGSRCPRRFNLAVLFAVRRAQGFGTGQGVRICSVAISFPGTRRATTVPHASHQGRGHGRNPIVTRENPTTQ